ncbi:MAG: pilin [Candidatus Microsaccharimonas sp.]
MKRFKLFIATLAFAFIGTAAFVPVATVNAINPLDGACAQDPGTEICKSENRNDNSMDLIDAIVNTLLFIVGTLAVIMIVVSGIWYVISAGDAAKVTRAKNTLTYSIVGLVIAFLAYAIINWVLKIF